MKDAFIITESAFDLSDFKEHARSLFDFKKVSESLIEYYIPFVPESYFSISKDNSLIDLMEIDEQDIIRTEFGEFNIYICRFYEFHNLKSLVSSIPSNNKIIIDNDHKVFMQRGFFLNLNSYEEFTKGFE